MAREMWEPGLYPSVAQVPWVCQPALRGQCNAVARHVGERKLHLLSDHPDIREILDKKSQQRMENELRYAYWVAVAAMEEGVTSMFDPRWFNV